MFSWFTSRQNKRGNYVKRVQTSQRIQAIKKELIELQEIKDVLLPISRGIIFTEELEYLNKEISIRETLIKSLELK